MSENHSDVTVARAYSIFYWINALLISSLVAVVTPGVGIFLLAIFAWHKMAVVNRTKIIFEDSTKFMTFQIGRWFVKDDDRVPVNAIDNLKLNRSVPGKIFGWVEISVETRSENYRIPYVDTKKAEQFRDRFLDAT